MISSWRDFNLARFQLGKRKSWHFCQPVRIANWGCPFIISFISELFNKTRWFHQVVEIQVKYKNVLNFELIKNIRKFWHIMCLWAEVALHSASYSLSEFSITASVKIMSSVFLLNEFIKIAFLQQNTKLKHCFEEWILFFLVFTSNRTDNQTDWKEVKVLMTELRVYNTVRMLHRVFSQRHQREFHQYLLP